MQFQSKILRIIPSADIPNKGLAIWAGQAYPCALGKGFTPAPQKREGDGLTPTGLYPLRWVYYRPDRVGRPKTILEARPLAPRSGWCDDMDHKDYNRPVETPFEGSCEDLWREDHLYDLMIVIGHNDAANRDGGVRRKLGSAIFLHVARDDYAPTRGCVALAREHLEEIINSLTPDAMVRIHSAEQTAA